MDRFLYDRDLRHERVKVITQRRIQNPAKLQNKDAELTENSKKAKAPSKMINRVLNTPLFIKWLLHGSMATSTATYYYLKHVIILILRIALYIPQKQSSGGVL